MNIEIDFFAKNKQWAKKIRQQQPDFFKQLAIAQKPNYLWISCSDSRVPANMICDLLPGELFVHRNIANQVLQSDMNCLSVLQYAIDVLKINNIIIVGHYGCGGVAAAMNERGCSIVETWIHGIAEVIDKQAIHARDDLTDQQKLNLACEQNVLQQVQNVKQTSIINNAVEQGRRIKIYGWIYNLEDGLLNELVQA